MEMETTIAFFLRGRFLFLTLRPVGATVIYEVRVARRYLEVHLDKCGDAQHSGLRVAFSCCYISRLLTMTEPFQDLLETVFGHDQQCETTP